MKPSEALLLHRDDIRRIVVENNASNPRVFGSVVHGDDTEQSDLDILVDPIKGRTTLFSLASIQLEIQALTGIKTDVLTPMALHERFSLDGGSSWSLGDLNGAGSNGGVHC